MEVAEARWAQFEALMAADAAAKPGRRPAAPSRTLPPMIEAGARVAGAPLSARDRLPASLRAAAKSTGPSFARPGVGRGRWRHRAEGAAVALMATIALAIAGYSLDHAQGSVVEGVSAAPQQRIFARTSDQDYRELQELIAAALDEADAPQDAAYAQYGSFNGPAQITFGEADMPIGSGFNGASPLETMPLLEALTIWPGSPAARPSLARLSPPPFG